MHPHGPYSVYKSLQSKCFGMCQMDKKTLFIMMIFHLVLDYDSLSFHLLMCGISSLLVLVEYCVSVGPLCTGLIGT